MVVMVWSIREKWVFVVASRSNGKERNNRLFLSEFGWRWRSSNSGFVMVR